MPYTYYQGYYYYVPSEEKTAKPKRVYDKEMKQLLRDKRRVEKALDDPSNNASMITVLERHLFILNSKLRKCEDAILTALSNKNIKYE